MKRKKRHLSAEFLAGTDPIDNQSHFLTSTVSTVNEMFEITFPTVTGRLYTLESSPTLAPNSWLAVETYEYLSGTGEPINIEIPINTDQFYRISVSLPDSE